MGSSYDQAVSVLYQAPHGSFVAERKRLMTELKAEGDKSGAAQFAKLERPPLSAWAVNQLWWHAREEFDGLFETAAQLRAGKLAAGAAHRKAIARLEARAQQLLVDGGHGANDATLRRVKNTLSGLAAAGGFEPDAPGALTKDRDAPGFEALGIASTSEEQLETTAEPTPEPAPADAAEGKREAEAAERKREAEAAERKREAEAAERKREAEAQAMREAQRKQAESQLQDAKAELVARERERDHLALQLESAERAVERARAGVKAAKSLLSVDE